MTSTSGHYATAVDDGDGLPPPSPQDQEVILDAWHQVLGQVLHIRDNEWKQQLGGVTAECRATVAELRASIAEICRKMEKTISERLSQIHQPADGKEGPRGEAGPPGRIKGARAYVEDMVHYEGDIVVRDGSTYQALCDTGRAPPDEEHWICVAARGLDGLSFRVRGTYQPGEPYSRLDVVALNGWSFVARRDNPGACPGDDWQALCFQGKRGPVGPKGDRGERGAHGSSIATCELEPERYTLILNHSDGTSVCINLRPFLSSTRSAADEHETLEHEIGMLALQRKQDFADRVGDRERDAPPALADADDLPGAEIHL